MSLDILILHVLYFSTSHFFFLFVSLALSLSHSVFLILNRSQMVEWETILILLLLVNSTESLCVCTHMYVMFASIWWDLFCHISFVILFFSLYASVSLSLSLPFSSVDNVVARYSLLFVFLFLIYCRTVIIVIRELCKFDDRLASMQAHYRLDVCIADRSKRGRVSSGLFCFILKRR